MSKDGITSYLSLAKSTGYCGPSLIEVRYLVSEDTFKKSLETISDIVRSSESYIDLNLSLLENIKYDKILELLSDFLYEFSICRLHVFSNLITAYIIPGPEFTMTLPIVRVEFHTEDRTYKNSLDNLAFPPIFIRWIYNPFSHSGVSILWNLAVFCFMTLIEQLVDIEIHKLNNTIQKLVEHSDTQKNNPVFMFRDISILKYLLQKVRKSFTNVLNLCAPHSKVLMDVEKVIKYFRKGQANIEKYGDIIDIPVCFNPIFKTVDINIKQEIEIIEVLSQYLPASTTLVKYTYEKVLEVNDKINMYKQENTRAIDSISVELSALMQYIMLALTITLLMVAIVQISTHFHISQLVKVCYRIIAILKNLKNFLPNI